MKKQNEKIVSWSTGKKHTLSEIKEFYRKIMLLPKEILDHIIFYGGTIIYFIAQSENAIREFGDIDILVPVDKMNLVRSGLEKIESLVIQHDGKKVVEGYNIKSYDGIQDFGFKGCLFGVKLSVHPPSETRDGTILSKWIKIKNDEIDLIANCVMLKNSSIKEIICEVKSSLGTLNIIKPELQIGWKKRRVDLHDEQDIKLNLIALIKKLKKLVRH